MTATALVRASDLSAGDLVRADEDRGDFNRPLPAAQEQLVQSEKVASIGRLAAGAAHEINDPIGCILSNLSTLEPYFVDLFRVLAAFESCEPRLADPQARQSPAALRPDVNLDYLKGDIPTLLAETRDGSERVRKIAQERKDLSHVDTHREWEWTDLQKGIDSTPDIVGNEIKCEADVVERCGSLPPVRCLASEPNQVYLGVLVNAAHAIKRERGTIIARTGASDAEVWVESEDDGCGFASEHLPRVFAPFFMTKPGEKGTGLGRSPPYGSVMKHTGGIDVDSLVGRGTRVRVTLPVDPAKATS